MFSVYMVLVATRSSVSLTWTWITKGPPWNQAFGEWLVGEKLVTGPPTMGLVSLNPNELHGFAFLGAATYNRIHCSAARS